MGLLQPGAWSMGGKTIAEDCQMLCQDDNRRKSGR